jgi:hypothetical protein
LAEEEENVNADLNGEFVEFLKVKGIRLERGLLDDVFIVVVVVELFYFIKINIGGVKVEVVILVLMRLILLKIELLVLKKWIFIV